MEEAKMVRAKQRKRRNVMDTHAAVEYIPHKETMATRLESIGFTGDGWITHGEVTSKILTKGAARVSVWHHGDEKKMVACVSHPGDEPDEAYWEAREITDPKPISISS
jgi:hypothetical protein